MSRDFFKIRKRTKLKFFLILTYISIEANGLCFGENKKAEITAFADYMEIGPEAFKALLEALADPDERVSASAADALGQLGTYARDAIPNLLRLTQSKSLRARTAAFYALAEVEPEKYEKEAIKNIIIALDSELDTATPVAAWSAYRLGKRARATIHSLSKIISTCRNLDTCRYSIMAIGKMGNLSIDTLEALRMLSKHQDHQIRELSKQAIIDIESDD